MEKSHPSLNISLAHVIVARTTLRATITNHRPTLAPNERQGAESVQRYLLRSCSNSRPNEIKKEGKGVELPPSHA
jgi:hypothetical protein